MPYDEAASTPCQGVHADAFFSPAPEEIALAKAACAACPIRSSCLRLALERAEPCGVWGGELLLHGVPIPNPPRRGRPPKHAVA